MPKPIDLSGMKFGRLAVTGFGGVTRTNCGRSRRIWNCICDCGNPWSGPAEYLTSGSSKSCGCLQPEVARRGQAIRARKHGFSSMPEWNVWYFMINRCTDPKRKAYKYYGGRGIKVCDEWTHFPNFLRDMGPRPQGLTLERIDVNGNYEPSNCKWATMLEQNRNKRNSRSRRDFTCNA